MSHIYLKVLKKIYSKTKGKGYYNFGKIKDNSENYDLLQEMQNYKYVKIKEIIPHRYSEGRETKIILVPIESDLEAKITFEGINYLNSELRSERSSGNKLSKTNVIRILLTIIGILITTIALLLKYLPN